MKLLVLHGSSREQGNTALLVDRVIQDLPHKVIHVQKLNLAPLVDHRHSPEGFLPSYDDLDQVVEELLAHDLLLIATPLYWYGLPAPLKMLFDRWSEAMRRPRWRFREQMAKKKVYAVIVGGDNPRLEALPLVLQLKHILDFVGADFAGYIIGQGNRPGEVLDDERAMFEAQWLAWALQGQVLEGVPNSESECTA